MELATQEKQQYVAILALADNPAESAGMLSTVEPTQELDDGDCRNVSNAIHILNTTPCTQTSTTPEIDLSMTPDSTLSPNGIDLGASTGFAHALLTSVTFMKVQVVCFSVIFVLGIIGNGLLLGLNAYRRSRKQAVTQIFMCALSLSDVGYLLGDTWIKALMASSDAGWTLGSFMCRLNSFWKTYSADSSVLTLAVISLDRFLGLSKPGSGYFSVKSALSAVCAVWLTAAGLNAPMFFWFDVTEGGYGASKGKLCTILVPDDRTFVVYTLLSRLITFFVPLAVTWGCYIGLWYRMASSATKMVGPAAVHGQSAAAAAGDSQASRRVARICAAVVAVFTVAWTPFEGVLLYYAVFAYGGQDKQRAIAIMQPLIILANVNVIANPIIYGFMWKPMKTTLIQVFWCKRAKRAVQPISVAVSSIATTAIQLRSEHDNQR